MQTSLYSVTIPTFRKALTVLSNLLDKAAQHIKETGETEAALLDRRLIADMFPLVKQVQSTCDNAKFFPFRIAGTTPPSFPDTETTIAELQERIKKTIEILDGVKPEDVDGKENAEVVLPFFEGKHLTGFHYAFEFLLPNFFFHFTTAYDILRASGVQIGKNDYLGGLPLQDAA